jgi:hypothetical protein
MNPLFSRLIALAVLRSMTDSNFDVLVKNRVERICHFDRREKSDFLTRCTRKISRFARNDMLLALFSGPTNLLEDRKNPISSIGPSAENFAKGKMLKIQNVTVPATRKPMLTFQ